MKTYIVSKGIYFFIAAFTFIAISGCDSTNSDDEAPEVIPSEVFLLPVDLFNQAASQSAAEPVAAQPVTESASQSSMPGVNFTSAALRVWPVSLLISANLIIPSVTTIQALDATPVFEDGAWIWTSAADNNGQTIEFNLSATRNGNATNWSMKISSTGGLQGQELSDFELFTAETSEDGEIGSWQLFYFINGASQNVLNATYANTSATEKAITFSIPESAGQGAGDSVEYRENGDERSFIWEQVAESISHNITWNAMTTVGSISATNFNGGSMGCWDEGLEDVACSPS
ncbi:MAG: hypothetical protein AB8G77_15705 [Rhodothermales bacterium]